MVALGARTRRSARLRPRSSPHAPAPGPLGARARRRRGARRRQGSYGVAPYFASKLAAESPIGALFPLLFAALVYPAAGLHPRLSRSWTLLKPLSLPGQGVREQRAGDPRSEGSGSDRQPPGVDRRRRQLSGHFYRELIRSEAGL
jgi:hypothetical protein